MSDKLKVACICTDLSVPVNGWQKESSIQIQAFVAALTAAGCEVHLFAVNVEFSSPEALAQATVHPLTGSPKRSDCWSQRKVALLSNRVLASSLEEQGPFDLVYEWLSLWSGVGIQHAVDHGIAGILHVDTRILTKLARYRRLAGPATTQQFVQRRINHATAVITDSHDVASYLVAAGTISDRIHILPGTPRTNGKVVPRTEWASEPSRIFTVGYVGNLDNRYPIDELVCSFESLHRLHPRSRLLIVGGGRGSQAIRNLLDAKGLSAAATLTGCLSVNETRALQRHMHVIVVPATPTLSRYASTSCLLENMASGAVVVARDDEQARRVIHNGVTGVLYTGGDVSDLTGKLTKLLHYPHLAESLSENAHRYVCQNFSMGNTCQEIFQIAHRNVLQDSSRQWAAVGAGISS